MSERARILVVNDEPGLRESLRTILEPQYEIATADSGEAALEALPHFHPDLVFIGLERPQTGWIELLRGIKRADASIEVVVITASASRESAKSALTHGALAYLIKPVSPRDLEEAARRALARRHAEVGPRRSLAALVDEMRSLSAKTRRLTSREQTEPSLRATQLSILREILPGLLGQLDLDHLTAAVTGQLRAALGYDEVVVHLGSTPPADASPDTAVCPIAEAGTTLGFLVAVNRGGSRPIDPRERELLEMLSEYLAVAIRNSRLYGEVAEREQSLEQIIRSAPDAIIPVDREGYIGGWNPAAERIFGWTLEQAIGTPLTAIIPEGASGAARAALNPEQPAGAFDVTARRPDGRTLGLAVTLSPLIGRDGRADGMLAIVRDTSAQRELEAQMHQSEKLTALGHMAGGIAHDFNNLLQAILGYAQLMAKNPGNIEVVRRGLDVIEKAATGGAETVRRIQKFARLRPEEAFVALDLDQVIRDALAITRPRWEDKTAKVGVPLELDLDLGGVPPIMGRPAELNEVVTNLILNAIDAMPEGGTLRIATHQDRDRHVVLVVTDTGIGMAEDVRDRVFDPFFTTKGEEGTGLGLSVSYSIVQRHGGEMRVDSRPGAGTTFTVRLPIGTPTHPEAPTGTEPIGNRTGRILLVDNDYQVMTILEEMLRGSGHRVVAVGGGAEALRSFEPRGFDLVVTNIGMTGMNGWELAERLRERDPGTPVVLITGWGMHEKDLARCRELGIASLLFKPVRPSELHTAVQRALTEAERRTRRGAQRDVP
ncbi:MAG: hypothetical protein C5B48_08185 [Candidatus Rokuibacteriota bacterium]|nr:MAG: hypothetical protein C5B48_08185 [Candidatus Rokubacteria bacterium]